jgi:hypothetical protein
MEEPIIKKEDKLQYRGGFMNKPFGTLTLTATTLLFQSGKKTIFVIPVKEIVSVNTKKGLGGGSDRLIVFYREDEKEKQVTIEHFYAMLGVALGGLAQLGPTYFASWELAINNARFGKMQANSGGIDDLEKLAELKQKGVITEEEFTAKKKQILGI